MNRSGSRLGTEVRTAAWILIGLSVLLIVALCVIIPAFGAAVWETLYCSFSGVQCVRVLP
jgi:uncharacterized membrane protein